MKIDYSLIISTYNWPSALKLILGNLLPQLQSHLDVEVIIADDGSTHETEQLIKSYQEKLPARIKHIWIEDLGFRKSIVLNKAVLASEGSYLMFLDGDCIPFPDYLEQHKKLAKTGYFVAGNRVLLSKEYTQELINNPGQLKQIFNWGLVSWVMFKVKGRVNKILPFLRLNPNARWRYSRSTNWKYPKGCNIGMFRSDYIAVNGYDEVFSGWGHEDADLFIRLLHNKVQIKDGRFAIPVLHLWHKESSRINESENYARLMQRLSDENCILALEGLNKYQ